MKSIKILSIFFMSVFLSVLVGCNRGPKPTPEPTDEELFEQMWGTKEEIQKRTEDIRKNPPVKGNERTLLVVPSDAKATYYILERAGKYPLRAIVTEREGKSGLNYTKRECNCKKNTYKQIFTGETEKEIKAYQADKKMTDLVTGSIAFYTCEAACKK